MLMSRVQLSSSTTLSLQIGSVGASVRCFIYLLAFSNHDCVPACVFEALMLVSLNDLLEVSIAP